MCICNKSGLCGISHSPEIFIITHYELRITNYPYYHIVKNQPARGDRNIIITEKVNDSAEVRAALCSEGNISCKTAFVLTCSASSPAAEINPPRIIMRYRGECSAARPVSTRSAAIANTRLYSSPLSFKISFEPIIPPSSIISRAGPSAQLGIPFSGSFACKKNSRRISAAPTKELQNISFTALFSLFRKAMLSLKQEISFCEAVLALSGDSP